MSITIALTGNPNCGKTTLFNNLTGSSQYVGNWPGVTVEKKEGKLKGNKDVIITDLPGIYSLSPYTLEEVVSRDYLLNESPDVILNIIDGTNLERNLYLTTQLLEIGIPVVVAVNMIDLVQKNKDRIDIAKLSKTLGCEVVETSALKGNGAMEAAQKAIEVAKANASTKPKHAFSDEVEAVLNNISECIKNDVEPKNLRWYSIKLFEKDSLTLEKVNLKKETLDKINATSTAFEEKLDDDAESIITNERYGYITSIISSCYKRGTTGLSMSDKIDRIVTNRFLALPIFVALMSGIYFISLKVVGKFCANLIGDVFFGTILKPGVESFLTSIGAADWITGLICKGILSGVGSVLSFAPQIAALFFFLSILEDCGYMARVAFIMDRIFRKFGLSGKSFISFIISSGCGVPAVLATKTIENDNDRRMTIMTTNFVPCGGKLPLIALISAAIFGAQMWWLAPAIYFISIGSVIVSGIILKKTRAFAGEPAPFVMELPQYHFPSAKTLLMHVWERVKAFMIKAGTVILLASTCIWFLSNFGFTEQGFTMVKDTNISLLSHVGKFFSHIFAPIGFGGWEASVATISGLFSKESLVSTFGVLFGLKDATSTDQGLLASLGTLFPSAFGAISFLVFNTLCFPCFAAIGAIRREMASGKWTAFAVAYQTVYAYVISLFIYQIGGLLTGAVAFSLWTIVAFVLLAILLFLLFRPAKRLSNKKVNA